MKAILDTHAFLWFIWADPRLSEDARGMFEEPSATLLLSTASLWEMCIKSSLGKLSVPLPFEQLVEEHVLGNGIELVYVLPSHLDCLAQLPFHHRDPFDRLIIAQAICEKASLVSRDSAFAPYNVPLVW